MDQRPCTVPWWLLAGPSSSALPVGSSALHHAALHLAAHSSEQAGEESQSVTKTGVSLLQRDLRGDIPSVLLYYSVRSKSQIPAPLQGKGFCRCEHQEAEMTGSCSLSSPAVSTLPHVLGSGPPLPHLGSPCCPSQAGFYY